jgi:hypothetical protein
VSRYDPVRGDVSDTWACIAIQVDSSPRCYECGTLEIDYQFYKVCLLWF